MIPYLLGAGLATGVGIVNDWLKPGWYKVKPSFGGEFCNRVFSPEIRVWLKFLLLYVPDGMMLFILGVVLAYLARATRRRAGIVGLGLAVFLLVGHLSGGRLIVFAWQAFRDQRWGSFGMYVSFLAVLFAANLTGFFVGQRIAGRTRHEESKEEILMAWARLAAPRPPLAGADLHCPRCRYCLNGLTEPRCPECGLILGASGRS